MRAAPARAARVSPGRRVAFAVLRRVFEQDAWADRTLLAEAGRAGLDRRDRALATRLAYGAVQRARTLDHLAATFTGRPVARLDPPVRAALRLGLYQLAFLRGVAAHAAVDESVELVKRAGSRGAGLVNAVLRRGAEEAAELVAALPEDTAEQAALRHSLPDWVARTWWGELGAASARALMRAVNEPAEAALRANTLVVTRDELRALLPVPSAVDPHVPDALVLGAPFDAHGSPLHAVGAFMPQSRAAQLVASILGPRPGDRVLDLCAAPGGKATHLAALSEDAAPIVAVERHPGRAAALRRTAARMHASSVAVAVGDAAVPRADGPFQRILVDPPCSGLGTLQARPDQRWRARPGERKLQRRILDAALQALAPGGALVYATCTIAAAENERVVADVARHHPGVRVEDLQADHPLWHHPAAGRHLLTLPHRDGTAGFFIARLTRER